MQNEILSPYIVVLNSCAAIGFSPLCANGNFTQPETINDMLEKLGAHLEPPTDEMAAELARMTIYSIETIKKAFV